jgi:hypothetical protein
MEALTLRLEADEKSKKIYPVKYVSANNLTGEIGFTVKEKQKAYRNQRKKVKA